MLEAARFFGLAAALSLGGCADHDCSLDYLVDEFVGTADVVDCGRFEASSIDDAVHRAAHDCVVAAYAQQHSFVVRWYTPGIEGTQRHAYAGLFRGGHYEIGELIQGYGVDTTVRPTIERSCTGLLDMGACAAPSVALCFMCVFSGEHTCEP